ncbi:ABC transporter permease [candidate division KSB1 bacterium]|nr:ABC transporter permease [candidate division KSB1 bacterium]
MFNNYLKMAFRNIQKFKGYSIINITGLTLGMTCCIFILLWVQHELSYDRFHEHADSLYRVIDYEKYSNGDELTFSTNPPALAPVLKEEYPEINELCRIIEPDGAVIRYQDNSFNEENILCADPAFFSMFSFPFVEGKKETVLKDPSSIVISEKMANKYFGDVEAVGKTLRINNTTDFLVAGVFKDLPSNSHIHFDFVLPFEAAKLLGNEIEGWNSYAYTFYVLLNVKTDVGLFNQKIKDTIKRYDDTAIVELSLQPVVDIHLRSGDMWGIGGDGDIRYVYLFSMIAVLILLVACINYMNLTTAYSGNRTKEIGLRKVIGARRSELILQYMGESVILAIIALIFSILLVFLCLPFYNTLSGKEFVLNFSNYKNCAILLFGVTILTGIIAGSYPALFLSSFKPVIIFKGNLKIGSGNSIFRKILVSMQFVLSICLIITTLTVNRQMFYLKNKKLGFNNEHLLYIYLPGELGEKTELIKNEFNKNNAVQNSSVVSSLPLPVNASFILDSWDGRQGDDKFLTHFMSVDYDFLNTMELTMAEGRFFSKEFPSDTQDGAVVNETAVRVMGMESPIGKNVGRGKIIGVMQDYHFRSLHSKITPLLLIFSRKQSNYILIRLKTGDVAQSLQSLETTWRHNFAEYPFEYRFLDERINKLYSSEQQVEKIMKVFTLLAVFIACLGLFGLASFTTAQRRKEIGIRKVLGLSVGGIVKMLANDFTQYVLYANLISWPVAWFAMSKWLQNFAYRIQLHFWMFLTAGVLALCVALLTIGYHSIRAATANPVEALRYE